MFCYPLYALCVPHALHLDTDTLSLDVLLQQDDEGDRRLKRSRFIDDIAEVDDDDEEDEDVRPLSISVASNESTHCLNYRVFAWKVIC